MCESGNLRDYLNRYGEELQHSIDVDAILNNASFSSIFEDDEIAAFVSAKNEGTKKQLFLQKMYVKGDDNILYQFIDTLRLVQPDLSFLSQLEDDGFIPTSTRDTSLSSAMPATPMTPLVPATPMTPLVPATPTTPIMPPYRTPSEEPRFDLPVTPSSSTYPLPTPAIHRTREPTENVDRSHYSGHHIQDNTISSSDDSITHPKMLYENTVDEPEEARGHSVPTTVEDFNGYDSSDTVAKTVIKQIMTSMNSLSDIQERDMNRLENRFNELVSECRTMTDERDNYKYWYEKFVECMMEKCQAGEFSYQCVIDVLEPLGQLDLAQRFQTLQEVNAREKHYDELSETVKMGLTQMLSGDAGEVWRLLPEWLNLTTNPNLPPLNLNFLGRNMNPARVILDHWKRLNSSTVRSLYDVLMEKGMETSAAIIREERYVVM